MNKVTGINLNGNAYQLEEPGFAAISAYLESARAQLSGNPDQAEIMADLEQAIADKFRRFLSAHKSVVTESEVETVIREMGPVGGEAQTHEDGAHESPHGPKRLYRVVQGEWIAGVANGVAAYFKVDVTLIRLLFILLIIATTGGFIFAYLLAWIFIPVARTQEEQAAASGAPFNAEELIARAKAEYARFGDKSARWKKELHKWKKEKEKMEKRTLREVHRDHLRTHQYDWYGRQFPRRHSGIGELMGIIVFSFFVWLGYHHVPAIHDFLDAAWALWHRVADQIAQFIADHDQG